MAWNSKANLRGADGYNATGAAEDAQALADFTNETGGPNPFAAALAARVGQQIDAAPVGPHAGKDAGPRAIIFGTSLEAQSGGLPSGSGQVDAAMSSRGWPHHMNAYLEQRFTFVRNAGIGGNTFAQMRARLDADVLAYPSEWVFIGGPVNDVAAGRSTALIKADLDDMHNRILATGRQILQLTCAPSDFYDSAAKKLVVDEINAYIWTLHKKRSVVVSDAFELLRVPGAYGPAVGNVVDGVHFSEQGAHLVGRQAAATVAATLPPLPRTLQQPPRKASVIGNAGFDAGTGWSAPAATATATYPNDGRLILKVTGQTVVTDDGVTYTENISSGRFAVGDYVQAVARFRWWNATPLAIAGPFRPYLRIQQRRVDSTFGTESTIYFAAGGDNRIWTAAPERAEMVVVTQRLLVTANTDRLYVRVGCTGMASASIEVSGLQVYKA